MSMSDPIADMLTRMRNACACGARVVVVPHSRLKGELARVLQQEGYIARYAVEPEGVRTMLRLHLKYQGSRQPTIRGLRRVSTPGLRRYVRVGQIPRVLGGMGTAILSTPAGVLTDAEARKRRVGGEVLCCVW
jgi:small subunit ribosomal protein S8